jgi:hypothetical protein
MKPKIILIIGHGRSGTTLLDKVISKVVDGFSAGEVHRLWTWSMIKNWECACGKPFKECDVWKQIMKETYEKVSISRAKSDKLWHRTARPWHIPQLFLPGIRSRGYMNRLRCYRKLLKSLYYSIKKVSNKNIIVDSSISPIHGKVVSGIKGIKTSIIHIERDCRAVAFSNKKDKRNDARGKRKKMDKKGLLRTLVSWTIYKVLSDRIISNSRKSAHISYKSLAKEPKQVMGEILTNLGLDGNIKETFIDEKTIEFRKRHTVLGNPMRQKTGKVEIKYDEEWKNEMSSFHKKVISISTNWFE